jgi:ABC-type glycerol-3-phosphate transport system substrate-binding protein
MKKRFKAPQRALALCLLGALLAPLAACSQGGPLDPAKPVTVTMWHTYVEDM